MSCTEWHILTLRTTLISASQIEAYGNARGFPLAEIEPIKGAFFKGNRGPPRYRRDVFVARLTKPKAATIR
jgi:hypothetical protein